MKLTDLFSVLNCLHKRFILYIKHDFLLKGRQGIQCIHGYTRNARYTWIYRVNKECMGIQGIQGIQGIHGYTGYTGYTRYTGYTGYTR